MKKILKIGFIILTIALITLFGVTIFLFVNIFDEARNIDLNSDLLQANILEVKIFDSNNSLQNYGNYRGEEVVKLNEINPATIDAFLCIEDKNFYEHSGINYKRIVKAMYNNMKSGHFAEGASTISQQLIKNTHLTNEKTFSRKIKEIAITKKLESQFSKNEILEMYFNIIYFGKGCFGLQNASKYYFDKPASELNLPESAMLASMIKAPATYSPINHPERTKKRRDLVLSVMKNDGKISQEEYIRAASTPLEINIKEEFGNNKNDVFIDSVINQACKILQLNEKDLVLNGYKIYTYLDCDSQKVLSESIETEKFYHKNSFGNIADSMAVIIDNDTNGIVAYGGKSDYNLINLKRQPGSAIKPILVYAPALENKMIAPATLVLDEKIDIAGYSPNNVGKELNGYISVRDSICKSLNIPAVKILNEVGIDNAKKFANSAGIEFSANDNGLALSLGGFTNGITIESLTNSFTTFANLGKFNNHSFIKEIKDAHGVTIYSHTQEKTNIMGEDSAYLMTDMLIDGVKKGTSKNLNTHNFEVAGKTGTVAVKNTNLNTDAISIAYTKNHSFGVWLGNYTYKSEYNLEGKNNGGTFATHLLNDIITKQYYAKEEPRNFERPSSIIDVKLDALSISENHKLVIVDENYPERFSKSETFSMHNLPPTNIGLLYNYIVDDIVTQVIDNNTHISLNLKKFIIYELIRNTEGKEVVLQKYYGVDDKVEFVDKKPTPNIKHTYYLKYSPLNLNNYNISNKETVIIKQKNITDIFENKQQNIINKQEKNSWYFY